MKRNKQRPIPAPGAAHVAALVRWREASVGALSV